MKNYIAKHTGLNALDRHIEAIKGIKNARPYATLCLNNDYPASDGLADLQRTTLSRMQNKHAWGFNNLPFQVKRQKLDNDVWKLTVENPKTREIILEAEGHGDKVFAYEDSLARMAEALSEKGLTITTKFDR
ncbi:MAG: hypothetical protein OQL09_03685 [Gammaproteobacteria bacterium]|nr:hypothetical protein [Gammaproteobacteria bacterium]